MDIEFPEHVGGLSLEDAIAKADRAAEVDASMGLEPESKRDMQMKATSLKTVAEAKGRENHHSSNTNLVQKPEKMTKFKTLQTASPYTAATIVNGQVKQSFKTSFAHQTIAKARAKASAAGHPVIKNSLKAAPKTAAGKAPDVVKAAVKQKAKKADASSGQKQMPLIFSTPANGDEVADPQTAPKKGRRADKKPKACPKGVAKAKSTPKRAGKKK